jgi:hypothetical protein
LLIISHPNLTRVLDALSLTLSSLSVYISPHVPSSLSLSSEPPTPPQAFMLTLLPRTHGGHCTNNHRRRGRRCPAVPSSSDSTPNQVASPRVPTPSLGMENHRRVTNPSITQSVRFPCWPSAVFIFQVFVLKILNKMHETYLLTNEYF